MKRNLCFFFVLLFIVACGPSYEISKPITLHQGSDTKVPLASGVSEGQTPININYMVLNIDAEWSSTSSAEQRALNDFATALGLNGSTPSVAGEALTLTDVASKFFQRQETDNSNTDSNNPQTTNTTSNPAPVPVITPDKKKEKIEIEEPEQPESGEYNSSEVYNLEKEHEKMFTWLNESGQTYSSTENKSIKFVWDGCKDFIVPNAYNTTTRDGTASQEQAYYFSGMSQRDYRTPEGHEDHNDASIFSDPSCTSTKMTMFYNK